VESRRSPFRGDGARPADPYAASDVASEGSCIDGNPGIPVAVYKDGVPVREMGDPEPFADFLRAAWAVAAAAVL